MSSTAAVHPAARANRGLNELEKLPGELRRSQNWIEAPDNRPETAVFLPPPVDDMVKGFDDLERFIQEQQLLPQPLLYLSAFSEHHRSDYYDFLQGVRERGELRQWIDFFLTGVAEQANEAVATSERLVDLREDYRARLAGDRSRAHEVLDLLLINPVLTTKRVAAGLGTSIQSASNHIKRLKQAGIIESAPGIPAGRSAGLRCPSFTLWIQRQTNTWGRNDETAITASRYRRLSAARELLDRRSLCTPAAWRGQTSNQMCIWPVPMEFS
ncbi:hypothetical protein BH20ACT4_BH20ACT4_08600 [soil metagenome]